jgi:hypothetical protein
MWSHWLDSCVRCTTRPDQAVFDHAGNDFARQFGQGLGYRARAGARRERRRLGSSLAFEQLAGRSGSDEVLSRADD